MNVTWPGHPSSLEQGVLLRVDPKGARAADSPRSNFLPPLSTEVTLKRSSKSLPSAIVQNVKRRKGGSKARERATIRGSSPKRRLAAPFCFSRSHPCPRLLPRPPIPCLARSHLSKTTSTADGTACPIQTDSLESARSHVISRCDDEGGMREVAFGSALDTSRSSPYPFVLRGGPSVNTPPAPADELAAAVKAAVHRAQPARSSQLSFSVLLPPSARP